MRTCKISWASSNFGPIGPRTTELSALECLKITNSLLMGMMMSPLFHSILFILADNKDMHKNLGTSSKFGQIRQPAVELAVLERVKNPHRLTMGTTMSTFSRLIMIQSL